MDESVQLPFIELAMDMLHKHGLNYRHLGLVVQELIKNSEKYDPFTFEEVVKNLIIEGVARTLKNLVHLIFI